MTVGGVLAGIAKDPVRFLASRWNWKAALLSGIVKGGIFFGAAFGSGLPAASRAFAVDAVFRLPMAGACAAVIQELRWATPAWGAACVALLVIPAVAHATEIAVHFTAATPAFWRGVAVSTALSITSSAAELWMMRRGVMLVEPGSTSLGGDARRLWRLARTGSV